LVFALGYRSVRECSSDGVSRTAKKGALWFIWALVTVIGAIIRFIHVGLQISKKGHREKSIDVVIPVTLERSKMEYCFDFVNTVIETSNPEETIWLVKAVGENFMSPEDWALLPEKDRLPQDEDASGALRTSCLAEPRGKGVHIWSDPQTQYGAHCWHLALILRVFQLRFKKAEAIILTSGNHSDPPELCPTTGLAVAFVNGEDWWFSPQHAAIAKIKELGATVPEGWDKRNSSLAE
jgi:hypothetical protein